MFSMYRSLLMYMPTKPVQSPGMVVTITFPVRLSFDVISTVRLDVFLETEKVVVALDGKYLASPG